MDQHASSAALVTVVRIMFRKNPVALYPNFNRNDILTDGITLNLGIKIHGTY